MGSNTLTSPTSPSTRVRAAGIVLLGLSLVVIHLREAVEELIGPPARATPVVIPLALLCAAALLVLLRRWPPAGVLPVVLLGASFAPGIATASLEGFSATKSAEFVVVTLGLAVAAVILVDSTPSVVRLHHSLLGAAAFVCTVALVLPGARSTDYFGRQSAFELNPLMMGRAGSLLAALAATAALYGSRRLRPAFVGLAVLGTYWTFASGARAAMLGLALALVALAATWWLARPGGTRLRNLVYLLGGAGVIALGIVLAPSAGLGRLLTRGAGSSVRFSYYDAAIDEIRSNPLGAGFGDFATVLRPGAEPRRAYAHNLFLEAGAEAGILAMVATVAFIVAALVFAWRHRDVWGRLLLPTMLVALGNAMFSSDINGNRIVLALAAIAISLGLAERRLSRDLDTAEAPP